MQAPATKAFVYSSVICTGIGPILYYLIQKGLTRTEYYQTALEQLHSHQEALEALGSPLQVHRMPILSKDHLVDIADARLKIPVSGPKAKGHLLTRSTRSTLFQSWSLQEVILELTDGQQIPVFKHSEEEK